MMETSSLKFLNSQNNKLNFLICPKSRGNIKSFPFILFFISLWRLNFAQNSKKIANFWEKNHSSKKLGFPKIFTKVTADKRCSRGVGAGWAIVNLLFCLPLYWKAGLLKRKKCPPTFTTNRNDFRSCLPTVKKLPTPLCP